MAYGSNAIETTEDMLAAISAIAESVIILVARQRTVLTEADAEEYNRILAALERMKDYTSKLRNTASIEYQERLGRR